MQKTQFEYAIKANVYIAYERIMPNLMKNSTYILNRDESAIHIVDSLFTDIDLVEMWNSDLTTIETKSTIWNYIQTLLAIGTKIYMSKHN